MSSHWNNNIIVRQQQRQEQLQAQAQAHHHQQQSNHHHHFHVQQTNHSLTTSNNNNNNNQHQVKELTWENGQLAMHGLNGLTPQGPSKPIWARAGDTLESVVHQATCPTQPPNNNNNNNNNVTWPTGTVGSSAVKWAEKPIGPPVPILEMRKRARSDSDQGGPGNKMFGSRKIFQEEVGGPSGCGSGSATFGRDSDTTMLTWASFESPQSFKTNKPTDEDSVSLSHPCLENQDEDGVTKGDQSGRSNSIRRNRAAAVHNQSERRRRDRINQKMKALQKLVPNASKTDKASMLDEVIEYLKQLQSQVQMMNTVRNLAPPQPAPQMMMPLGMQMSLLAARMGMGPTFIPPQFHIVPQPKPSNPPPPFPMTDPYCALLAQSMNMELYNKMAMLYSQQMSQSTAQATSSPSRSTQVQDDS